MDYSYEALLDLKYLNANVFFYGMGLKIFFKLFFKKILKKFFLNVIIWRRARRFTRLDNRGFFFWERRSGRKKRKFKKVFIARCLFNNTQMHTSDFFMSGGVKLLTNFNVFNYGLSLHNIDFEDFLNNVDDLKDFLFFSQSTSSLNFLKLYQH